jgi:hypothetical protein
MSLDRQPPETGAAATARFAQYGWRLCAMTLGSNLRLLLALCRRFE